MVEPAKELSIFLATIHARFLHNAFMKSSSGNPGYADFDPGRLEDIQGSAFVNARDQCPRVEAGSNTSTVTLRVVGGDEKGSLKSETVGTRTRERLRWQGPAAYTKDRPVLSSERAPHKNKTATVKEQ
jgi:hypothetical protein